MIICFVWIWPVAVHLTSAGPNRRTASSKELPGTYGVGLLAARQVSMFGGLQSKPSDCSSRIGPAMPRRSDWIGISTLVVAITVGWLSLKTAEGGVQVVTDV